MRYSQLALVLPLPNSPTCTCIVDGHLSQVPSQPVPNQPFKGETNLGDSSGFLFAMYSKLTQEEDTKMAERWQKDAEGIIIFVCYEVTSHPVEC